MPGPLAERHTAWLVAGLSATSLIAASLLATLWFHRPTEDPAEPVVESGDGPCALPPLPPERRLDLPVRLDSGLGDDGLGDDGLGDDEVSTAHLAAWIEWLSAPEQGGRRAGTGDTPPIADALGRALTEPPPVGLGLDPGLPGGPCQAFDVLGHREVNVIARLAPSGAASSAVAPTRILLAAHYDGQGRHPTRGPLPGADDNASGVAAVLEAARLLSRRGVDTAEVVIVLFGAEEVGLAGSLHWATRPSPGTPDLAIVLDMVGRPLPLADRPTGFAVRLHTDDDRLVHAIERASQASGVPWVPIEALGDRAPGRSDDHALAEAGIDVALITSGVHDDHHELGDTADAIDLDQVTRAARWLVGLIESIPPIEPPATDPPSRMRQP